MSASVLAKVPRSWILLAAIGLIALNMRGPFVAVAPVVGLMQQELGFSPVELGLLTGIPVLCFALASPLASLAGRKLGAEVAITLTLLGVLLGVIVRSAGNGAVVMLGTVILGVAITIGNIAVPLIIRRDFAPARQGTAMGIYTAALNIGSFLTAMVMAPLAELFGWRLALAASGLFAVAALVVWVLAVRPPGVPPRTGPRAGARPRRDQAGVALDHGGADRGLRRAGVFLLRCDRLAAQHPRGRTRHDGRGRPGPGPRCSRSWPSWAGWAFRSRPVSPVRRRSASPWDCCG